MIANDFWSKALGIRYRRYCYYNNETNLVTKVNKIEDKTETVLIILLNYNICK